MFCLTSLTGIECFVADVLLCALVGLRAQAIFERVALRGNLAFFFIIYITRVDYYFPAFLLSCVYFIWSNSVGVIFGRWLSLVGL